MTFLAYLVPGVFVFALVLYGLRRAWSRPMSRKQHLLSQDHRSFEALFKRYHQ